jgi:ATP adenylyltransferase
MELMWAPWRMGYIRSKEAGGCPFCIPPCGDEEGDRARHVLARGRHAYVCLNLYPYNNGHLLIPPYQHTGDITELPPEALAEMSELMRVGVEALGRWAGPQGFNVGYNLGEAGGAGVADHLHMHVIPRWLGDTSFLCVVSSTKVVVQALDESYDELRPLFVEAMERRGLAG